MKSQPRKIVLFDLGNVLVKFTPSSFWETLGIGDGKDRKRWGVSVGKASGKFERGEIDTEEYLRLLFEAFNGMFSQEEILLAVQSVLTTPLAGMENLVQRVCRVAGAGLVSNTNELHYAYCLSTVPALRLLTPHHLSFRIGAMKPDARFYAHVINESDRDPGQIILVDDVEENVRGAERAGMYGVLFSTPAALERTLKKEEVLGELSEPESGTR